MARLGPLVWQNLRRNLRHNLLSSIGIIVGIGSFTFFLALDNGVRRVVLGDIFPVDRLEVIPPKATLFGGTKRIDDAAVGRLAKPTTVAKPAAAYPKMKLAFPARGWGGKNIFGRDFYFEVSGFCDGIDDRMLAAEVRPPYAFRDFLAGTEAPPKCKATEPRCPSGLYCAWDVDQCHRPVPALISRHMIELYNGSIAPAHPNMPRIPDFATSLFAGRQFTVELGQSYLGTRARTGGKPIQRRFRLVGVSNKAAPLGLTIPLGYVKRWNRRYAGPAEASAYTSVVLTVRSKADITPLSAHVRAQGYDLAENQGEKVGLFITLATLLFTVISGIIVLIAAINIAHTFMMLIAERRREIGVLRAVGASRWQIRNMILAEAAIVGLAAGALGVATAWAAAHVADWYSATRVPDFPFKPATYFAFTPSLVAAAMGFAVLFCLLGAFLPAHRAARLQPAEALAAR